MDPPRTPYQVILTCPLPSCHFQSSSCQYAVSLVCNNPCVQQIMPIDIFCGQRCGTCITTVVFLCNIFFRSKFRTKNSWRTDRRHTVIITTTGMRSSPAQHSPRFHLSSPKPRTRPVSICQDSGDGRWETARSHNKASETQCQRIISQIIHDAKRSKQGSCWPQGRQPCDLTTSMDCTTADHRSRVFVSTSTLQI